MHSSIQHQGATSPDSTAAAMQLGNWQLERELGSGRWTVVYQARPAHGCSHADYALKLLKPEYARDPVAVKLLQREAQVGQEVSHPHLVAVLAARLDAPPFYLVTPRLQGASLRTILRETDRLDVPSALWFARQTAEALQALVEQGWLHADIKPDNLFVAPNGFLTLFDLGLARHPDRREVAQQLAGTPPYLPPEAFTLTPRWTSASDVYSLGVTLFELLTGTLPFPQSDPEALAAAVLTQLPPDPRAVNVRVTARVARLLRRMLAKNPLRRPAVEELTAWLIDLEIDTFEERPVA